jgi:hypothetical protein
MALGVGRILLVAGLIGAATATVSYLASPADIPDLRLVSVDAARLKDIASLKGESLPETPVFRVRFSTRNDLVALANGLDAYTVRTQVWVGDSGCNPALKTITYTRVAFMLLDFTRVYDDAEGPVDGRGLLLLSGSHGLLNHYVFYFGVVPSEMPEFVSSGLKEAPICFSLTGTSRTGRPLTSNLVPLPAETLADAAARLGS